MTAEQRASLISASALLAGHFPYVARQQLLRDAPKLAAPVIAAIDAGKPDLEVRQIVLGLLR